MIYGEPHFLVGKAGFPYLSGIITPLVVYSTEYKLERKFVGLELGFVHKLNKNINVTFLFLLPFFMS